MSIIITKQRGNVSIKASGRSAQALFDAISASINKAAPNTIVNATKPVPNRPSANAGASGPAAAENGSKPLKSKGA